MKVGLVKEIKRHEYRVGLTPQCVQAYRAACGKASGAGSESSDTTGLHLNVEGATT